MSHSSVDIVKRAADFCSSPRFERALDTDHAAIFADAAEAKDCADVEHKHEFKELHDRYLELFEHELTEFIESEGATLDEFFRECRSVVDGDFTALFEEHRHAWFVDHLLASMDYDRFYELMVREARQQQQQQQHARRK